MAVLTKPRVYRRLATGHRAGAAPPWPFAPWPARNLACPASGDAPLSNLGARPERPDLRPLRRGRLHLPIEELDLGDTSAVPFA